MRQASFRGEGRNKNFQQVSDGNAKAIHGKLRVLYIKIQ
jgi:hypothetical protein